MTEAEWLACKDPSPMVDHFREGCEGRNRKLRLFGVACCRRLTHLFTDAVVRKALDASERYADGRISDRTIRAWNRKAATACESVLSGVLSGTDSEPKWLAYHAVALVSVPNKYPGYFFAHRSVAEALAEEALLFPKARPASGDRLARATASLAHPLRDIFGNPFRPVTFDPAWLTPNVVALAQTVYEERELPSGHLDRTRLTVLADALLDAGCDSADILAHCRSEGPHVRGCWVVDLLLEKE